MKRSLIIILAILTLLSCNREEQTKEETKNLISVVVTKSIEKEYLPQLKFSGTAFANKEANLGTAIPGRVEKIYFDEGQHVNKGELLVELSSELYMQALIERNTLKKDYERVSRLRDKESISQQDFDHVKAKYDASVAKTELMKKNAEITAPFSGTIVDHIVQEGENFFFAPSLKPGYSMTSGIIKLMQISILKIEIDVNEKDISKIKKGQKAKIIFDAYPEKIYEGTIHKINPILSTMTRTAKAQIKIENKDLLIKPGMYAKVSIELAGKKDVFVPNEAIHRQAGTGNDFVFKVEENRVKKTPVKRIYTLNDLVAVKGINPNETIVVAGKSKLQDGMQVKVTQK